jgi:hypothetical protein
MILAISILAGLLTAGVSYRILFYDSGDFWDGCYKVTRLFKRHPRWIWQRSTPPPPPEHFEDESWWSGIRFFAFLAVSCGVGYFVYSQLNKHFG